VGLRKYAAAPPVRGLPKFEIDLGALGTCALVVPEDRRAQDAVACVEILAAWFAIAGTKSSPCRTPLRIVLASAKNRGNLNRPDFGGHRDADVNDAIVAATGGVYAFGLARRDGLAACASLRR
jgi:hypothetical protein